LSSANPEAWLSRHAYLQTVADLCGAVNGAAAGIAAADAAVPVWDEYAGDYRHGVPLLQSAGAAMDIGPGVPIVVELVERLSARPLPGSLGAQVSALRADLRGAGDSGRRIVAWLLGDEESLKPSSPGLLRYLGWTVLTRHLAPVVAAFGAWRDEERWLRRYCPTCGSLPAMAQLVGVDPGRRRLLACGCCGTRWQYGRTACPFCEADSQRLASVAVEGEGGLRIDHCESCRGYLKTYDGQGNEALLLADWTSLHLDLVAADRGLQRRAASLYGFAPAATEREPAGSVA
jgi:FdhE protein